jgi:CheY-like chemotaxis protein/tetratricopeptide (TPR) repeat protein
MAITILLVDDDPMARSAMERAILDDARLRTLVPTVTQAASGEQGLAMFVNDRPQVVVTDLIMTGMDGFAFCRAVREAPFGRDIGLIVISGIYKDASLAASLYKDVRATFLAKPFSRTELVEAILACLGLPGRSAVSMVQSTPPPLPRTSTPLMAGVPSENTPGPIGTEPPHSALPPDVLGIQTPIPIPGPTLRTTSQHAAGPVPPAGPANGTETMRSFPPAGAGRAVPGPTGSLADRGVARLLFDLTDGCQTGTLALTRGKMRKEIYLREGRVVSSDSNLRQEALGTLLCAKGIIDDRQLAYLLAETKARGHKMGAVLIELGWLSPEEVLQCLAAQVRKRILDCLRWDDGTWTFVPGDTFGDRIIEHDLDIERLIFLGLLRTTTPEKLVTQFDQNGARTIELTRRFAKHRPGFEAVFGAEITQVLAAGASVGSLALRDDAHLVIAAIDALLEAGLLELGAPVIEPEEAAPSNPWQSSFSLERMGNEISKGIIIPRPENPDEMFGHVRHHTAPAPIAQEGFSRLAESQDSGAMDVALRALTLAPEKEGDALSPGRNSPSQVLRQAVMLAYLTIRGKSLYEALGVLPTAPTKEILATIAAKTHEFSPAAVAGIELSPADQTTLEALRAALDHAARILANPQLRQKYDQSLAPAAPTSADPLGAELAFGEALQLLRADKAREALPKFEEAVRGRPDQALYHAYLGWAEFLAFGPGRTGVAREALTQALALDPDLADAHTMLGRLAATENDAATARKHLERSLELSPDQPETVQLLLEAYQRVNDPKGAEIFLRGLVASLGEQAQSLRRHLWCELAKIYENQLGNRDSARIAYDMAARLAPNSLDILRKSAEMNAEDPTRWRESAHAVAAEWQLHPEDGQAGARLVGFFQEQGQLAAAKNAAAAMVLRGLGEEKIASLADQGRPSELGRIAGKLPAGWPSRVGYTLEFADVEALVALLVDSGVLPPVTKADLGLEGESPIARDLQPEPFRQVLAYLCELFDMPEPPVLRHPALLGDARMAHLQPPVLLCGTMLLEQSDSVELGFRLSRAMALGSIGRLAASARSGGQLRPFFMAALATARGSLRFEGPTFETARNAIAALDAPTRARIADLSQRLVSKYGSINLTAWTKGLGLTAARMSLLVCGDLLRVGRAVADEGGQAALDDLLAFALSLEYLDFCAELCAIAS